MSRRGDDRRRVVVTGMGCVSALGCDVPSTWSGAVEGRSGVGPITRFDTSGYTVTIAAEVTSDVKLVDLSPKEARRLDPFIVFALAASREALADAALEVTDENRDRIGIYIGSGIGGITTVTEGCENLIKSGPRRVGPFVIPMTLSNLAAGYVSMRHGIRGPTQCHVSACASGANSIGEAARLIERGDADVALAGGSEAPLVGLSVAGFANMRALSVRNDEPQRASRPFDLDRDGFVMGEGAGILILEGLDHAQARGARIHAEVLGYGATADAHHLTAPPEDGHGSTRAMRLALADAGLTPEDVGYLNAHATSTPAGDSIEAHSIHEVFGAHTHRLPVSATKSMTAHLLGAAGAVEAIFCIRALESALLPPTINLDRPDPECELDHVANKAREAQIRIAMSNSFGFGGINATLVLGRWEQE